MKLISILILMTMAVACNNSGQGHRENQEEETTPRDYTSGKDSKEPARTR